MIDLEHIEIDGLLYPNIQLDDAEVYDDLGKYGNLRLNYLHKQKPQQYLERYPAPAEGIERIQAFKISIGHGCLFRT